MRSGRVREVSGEVHPETSLGDTTVLSGFVSVRL